jgi:hypothetical protein
MRVTVLTAAWPGFAEGDPTIVGIVVVVIAIFAIAFVLQRRLRGAGNLRLRASARPGQTRRAK